MTNLLPPTEFTVGIAHEPGTLAVRVAGELDYDTSDDLVRAVVDQLTPHAGLRDVHLDFDQLTWIDSTGLSALLMIHRRTTAIGATLRLDNRPECLERMLRVTNVLDHLTTPTTRADEPGPEQDERAAGTATTGERATGPF
ncbi:STAS domain-containing protein [Streptomyces sp. NPDC086787]|uniref:STAS domain-containing protein n=1 Tax=Streptomyces sp. NPDC086787 TaxID=3365759 RepID=UPI00380D7BBC